MRWNNFTHFRCCAISVIGFLYTATLVVPSAQAAPSAKSTCVTKSNSVANIGACIKNIFGQAYGDAYINLLKRPPQCRIQLDIISVFGIPEGGESLPCDLGHTKDVIGAPVFINQYNRVRVYSGNNVVFEVQSKNLWDGP